MTNEWARGAGLAGSPGNLVSVMGDSPSTQPSSYEDYSRGRLHHALPSHREQAFKSSSPASPSPANSVRRPLSFQMESHFHPDSLPQATPGAYRRSSLHSQISHARIGSHPPPPHQPQAHFYGTPDLDMTLTPQSGMKAGERGYFFGFDQLPSPDSVGGSDVVLAGYEGGLEVYAISKKRLEWVGSLKGLRGGVHHAKILPWTVTGDRQDIFPLVAVVLHGPVLLPSSPEVVVPSGSSSPRIDGTSSVRSMYGQQDASGRQQPPIKSYRTSVQVYSLKTNKLVDTLLQSPEIPISTAISFTSPIFQPPPPSGAFIIKADVGTMAICSGVTGECWIYLQLLEAQNQSIFACVGKLWTSLQQNHRGEVSEESDKTFLSSKTSRLTTSTPIFALNGRWIAYCPASPSSLLTMKAHVPVPLLGRSVSVSSVTPPQLPSAIASVDLISDSFVNKIMRETTQELISGAKWVGQQGLQAWNSYWNKTPSPQLQPQQGRSPPSQFPPTHGTSGQPAPKEPGLVSIVDAESLAVSQTITPLTSFVPPQGCSFLSFAPSSLALFTASSRGDVQTVWDLLRIHHTRCSPLQATISPNESTGPQVRQIAQFSRMTVARIVDVAWAEPHGERLAMTTERGTVHLLEMPFSAFMWPPPRRRKAVPEPAPESSETSASAVTIATGAFGAAYQAAKPFMSRSRRSSAGLPSSGGSNFKDTAAQGGRVIAASISNSLGKTGTALNQLRHAGENRVTLPSSMSVPTASSIKWLRGRKSHSLYGLGGGVVRVFPNRTRRASTQQGLRGARSGRYKDLRVPPLPDDVVAPAVLQVVDFGAQEEVLDLSDHEMEVGNTMTLNKTRPRTAATDDSIGAAIPQAEIESSAPYQPFHTDRRVALCEYSRETPATQIDSLSSPLANANIEDRPLPKKKRKQQHGHCGQEAKAGIESSTWAFGQDISAVVLDLGLSPVLDEDFDGPDNQALPPSAMERVMQYGDQEQIVVTTRKRRSARSGDGDADGFFEDDCEVLDFADQRV